MPEISDPHKNSTPTQIDPGARRAAEGYLAAAAKFEDRSYWAIKTFAAINLFLWHIDAFALDKDPVPLFAKAFDNGRAFFDFASASGICGGHFPKGSEGLPEDGEFGTFVSTLFSDIWVDMTDDIYFDETYAFTKERFEKNGIDPQAFFADKLVLDAGCGSGKFSATIARLGAKKVIGLDLGEKGIEFARAQSQKRPEGERLDYRVGSLLDIPLDDESVDIVWSNGVVHHTSDYEKCIEEFARVLKPGGKCFLYVNGRFGLFELLLDTLRTSMKDVPQAFTQQFLRMLGVNSGRLYWMVDCLYAPYQWKPRAEVVSILEKYGLADAQQLTRGVAIDQIEQVTTRIPYADVKYGDAQLKFIATKVLRS